MNGDGVFHLQKRLVGLPPDLESLYGHMLRDIEEIYIEETSKIFQLHRACLKRIRCLSIQMLDTALNVEIHNTFQMAFQSIRFADNSSQVYHKQQAKKLHSRCGGLLETQIGTGELHGKVKIPY
jgi:hypothetical protein